MQMGKVKRGERTVMQMYWGDKTGALWKPSVTCIQRHVNINYDAINYVDTLINAPFQETAVALTEIYLHLLQKLNRVNSDLTDLIPLLHRILIVSDKHYVSLSVAIPMWVWEGHLAATVCLTCELTEMTNNTSQMKQCLHITSTLINTIHEPNNVLLNNYLFLNKVVTKDTSNVMFCKFMIWRKLNLKKCFSPCFKPRNWCRDINSLSTWYIIKKQHILYEHTALHTGQLRT